MPCRHVHDIENDLEHTIPPEGGPDSAYLFRAMTERSLALLEAAPGNVVLDLGCGMGQDSLALAARLPGGRVLAVEPSNRMIRFGQGLRRAAAGDAAPDAGAPVHAPGTGAPIHWLRAFGEELPLRDRSVDALLCKGALDHFIDPRQTLAEVARVLQPGGRAVVALANYDSLACRLGRTGDRVWRRFNPRAPLPAHPFHEPPPDHVTRFGYATILALAGGGLRLRRVEGLSLLWGFGPWSRLVAALPRPLAPALMALAALAGRAFPRWADVIVIQMVRE
jgi:SAM-dependent methyltransferase